MTNHDAIDRLIEALQPLVEGHNERAYARRIGVSSGAVRKWMEGGSFPNGENAVRVAASLGMTPTEFQEKIVEGKPRKPTTPVEVASQILKTLPPHDLASVLRVLANRLEKEE